MFYTRYPKEVNAMGNTNKILLTIVSCVFMICVASVSIVSIVSSDKKETTTTTDAAPSQYIDATEDTTNAPSVSQQTTAPTQSSTVPPQSTTATTAPTSAQNGTTASSPASSGDLATDLLGSWKDSAGMSGYEFLEGGRFNWTYVDLAQFGVPFDGKTSGSYSLEGDTLTIKYSIYTATIKKTYRVSISQNELSMYDLEEHETSTYMRVS